MFCLMFAASFVACGGNSKSGSARAPEVSSSPIPSDSGSDGSSVGDSNPKSPVSSASVSVLLPTPPIKKVIDIKEGDKIEINRINVDSFEFIINGNSTTAVTLSITSQQKEIGTLDNKILKAELQSRADFFDNDKITFFWASDSSYISFSTQTINAEVKKGKIVKLK
jgi:hypothetical protein